MCVFHVGEQVKPTHTLTQHTPFTVCEDTPFSVQLSDTGPSMHISNLQNTKTMF